MVVTVEIDDCLYLHPSDTTGASLISFQLLGAENYQIWSCAINEALLVKNKLCSIDGSYVQDFVSVENQNRWDRCNAILKAWIHNVVAPNMWEDLHDMYNTIDGTRKVHPL